MSKLIPDYVFESIYDITPQLLRENHVRSVLIDLDGTMASHKAALPPDSLAPFVRALRDAGMKVLVFSNNRAARVEKFCAALGVASAGDVWAAPVGWLPPVVSAQPARRPAARVRLSARVTCCFISRSPSMSDSAHCAVSDIIGKEGERCKYKF